MLTLHYQDLMVRAVTAGDDKTLAKLAKRLDECEEALQLLRAKGYGSTGMSLPATVRLVPEQVQRRFATGGVVSGMRRVGEAT